MSGGTLNPVDEIVVAELYAKGDRRSKRVIVRLVVDGKEQLAAIDPAEAVAWAMRLYLAAKEAETSWRPEFTSEGA